MRKSPGPYIVGRWVRGADHYDRHSLVEYLLTTQDTAIWVVGTRRMGKTSLLRQLELLTDTPASRYVPLFWDLQGCAGAAELTNELAMAVEDAGPRFQRLGIELPPVRDDDAAAILRRLSRAVARQDRQLLLLVDEAEVLIDIAQQDGPWLARLRKAMQEGHQRTIIVSTKLLTQLTEQSRDWMTSPFLFGFHLVNMWTLNREGALALVCQAQAAQPVAAGDEIVEQILACTNHHPYLIQYLCQRLYEEDGQGGRLRAVEDADLEVDALLAGFFDLDYRRLTALERRILLAAAQANPLSDEQLHEIAGDASEGLLQSTLAALRELGHLRRRDTGWRIGSEFLLRWLRSNAGRLHAELLQDDAEENRGPEESPVEAAARTLGISVERVQALVGTRIANEAEFFDVVRSLFYEIRHVIEQDDGYKLLITTAADGTPTLRSEEDVQIALKHWLRPMCRALNIDMDRELRTGRGFLDFKFSIGHDLRCMAEVKLFNNTRLQNGLGNQMPIYMMADKLHNGIYVPIFLEASDHLGVVAELKRLAEERARELQICLDVIDIRAWKPKTASKTEIVEERERYQLPARTATVSVPAGEPHRATTLPRGERDV